MPEQKYDYRIYNWRNCDIHVHKFGNILQYNVHIYVAPSSDTSEGINISWGAYEEIEVYSLDTVALIPAIDVFKVPLVCDSSLYPNCYFSAHKNGKFMFGTRDRAVPVTAKTHFYGAFTAIANI